MSTQAFTPAGNTFTFTANTAAPNAVQVLSITGGANQYRIINPSGVTVFLGSGTTANIAGNNAVISNVGNSQPSIPLLGGTDEILTFAPNAWFTGITASGNASIYITPGDGM